MSQFLEGRTIVVAGATSAAGGAVVRALSAAGSQVAAVGTSKNRIHELSVAFDTVSGYVCDLSDIRDVEDLGRSIRSDLGAADGLIHLVGGWRGGNGIPGQTDADWDFLRSRVLTTLRNTTRVFYEDLVSSPNGRLAIVSAHSAASPQADSASYAAVKAAAEAWTLAVADGFRQARASEDASSKSQGAAAVIFTVKALVDAGMRAAHPERKFPGYTDVEVLAEAVELIFGIAAAKVNGRRLPVKAGQPAGALI